MIDTKLVLVYHSEGSYDEITCEHDYIGVFPKDATIDEIQFAIGESLSFVVLDVHTFVTAQKRVFVREIGD
jgi:hypothetical protein